MSIGSNIIGGDNSGADKFGDLFKDEFAVILLQGKNSFGNMIYSYVKVALPDIKRLYSTMNSGEDFSPSDFGTIVASGTGIPTDEVRQEIASAYKTMPSNNGSSGSNGNNGMGAYAQPPQPITSPIPAAAKKAWDEF